MLQPKNVIVKMPNWIGDAVMATPILADLKQFWKQSKLTAMCQANIAKLIECDPNVDEILSYSKPSGWSHRIWHRDAVTPLQRGHYDLGILLTNSFSSAFWFWKGNVQNIIGYTNGLRNLFLDQAIPLPKPLDQWHQIDVYKHLLEPLGITLSTTLPKLYLGEQEKKKAQDFLKKQGVEPHDTVIGINPGAAYGSAKCWLPDRFREVAFKLQERSKTWILFFGDDSTAPLIREICRDAPDRVLNLAGKTNLRELMALIHACSIFLTNDSGPMHIASAFHVPLIALFGSTDASRTGPYHHEKVIYKKQPCSPCFLRKCPKRGFPCMTNIKTQEVYQELLNLIKENEL
ncbi:MAG: lipopolysaccharide heptosyltransferase II [Parachlamydiaceae bacterium]